MSKRAGSEHGIALRKRVRPRSQDPLADSRQRRLESRIRESAWVRGDVSAEVVATGCPFCKVMLSSSEGAQAQGAPEVIDVAQLVAAKLDGIQALLDG